MEYLQAVTDAARSLKLLDGTGKLVLLDSLTIVDLITELETTLHITIPLDEIRNDVFSSLENVSALLSRLAATSQ